MIRSGLVPCLALLILAACPGSPALAAPDRPGQETPVTTRLGQRLAAAQGSASAGLTNAAFWATAKRVFETSDAAADARADAAAGHNGFMAHANDALADRPHAPGVFCWDRSEPGRRAVFVFHYGVPPPELGKALLAFDAYARAYNARVLAGGALGGTSCSLLE